MICTKFVIEFVDFFFKKNLSIFSKTVDQLQSSINSLFHPVGTVLLPRLRWFAVCSSAMDGPSLFASMDAAQLAPDGSGSLTEKMR